MEVMDQNPLVIMRQNEVLMRFLSWERRMVLDLTVDIANYRPKVLANLPSGSYLFFCQITLPETLSGFGGVLSVSTQLPELLAVGLMSYNICVFKLLLHRRGDC